MTEKPMTERPKLDDLVPNWRPNPKMPPSATLEGPYDERPSGTRTIAVWDRSVELASRGGRLFAIAWGGGKKHRAFKSIAELLVDEPQPLLSEIESAEQFPQWLKDAPEHPAYAMAVAVLSEMKVEATAEGYPGPLCSA